MKLSKTEIEIILTSLYAKRDELDVLISKLEEDSTSTELGNTDIRNTRELEEAKITDEEGVTKTADKPKPVLYDDTELGYWEKFSDEEILDYAIETWGNSIPYKRTRLSKIARICELVLYKESSNYKYLVSSASKEELKELLDYYNLGNPEFPVAAIIKHQLKYGNKPLPDYTMAV